MTGSIANPALDKGLLYCAAMRARLDYVHDHGREEDISYSDDGFLLLSARVIDAFFRDRQTARGRRAAAVHRLRERIREARTD